MVRNDVEALPEINDPLLDALVRADAAVAESMIATLMVDVAGPLVEHIVARCARSRSIDPENETNDVTATVHLRLLDRLRRIASSSGESIQDFEKYVASLTYNVVNDHMRRRFPEHARLKNRLRYIVTHDPRFALWSIPRGLACGLKEWSGSLDVLRSLPFDASRSTKAMRDRDRPAEALNVLFRAAGRPVEFDSVIAFAAEVWHVVDLAVVHADQAGLVAGEEAPPVRMERRELLCGLWREIRELPPMQRKALLLNFRDGDPANALSLFILTGIARFDELAAALEMPADGLASIWNELPLDDLRIGVLLNVTRQQVINLRKSARARLNRQVRQ